MRITHTVYGWWLSAQCYYWLTVWHLTSKQAHISKYETTLTKWIDHQWLAGWDKEK